jgi:hypothetical protein
MSKIEVDAIDKQSGSSLTLGGSGTAVTLACGATQTGFGRTGTVDWQTTPKTATFTAVSGEGYFANTSGGAFNMNLPAGVAGAIVSVADYAGTWQTNNLTVVPNGTDKIGSVNANAILSTQGQSVTFVYVDSTQGWINTMDSTSNVRGNAFVVATGGTITTSGNDKIHTFTGPGTFTVNQASPCATNNVVSYMVVAGGAGGVGSYGGGGGAGGFREVKNPVTPYTASPLDGYPSAPNRVTVTATAYPITVGGGGFGSHTSCSPARGGNGNNSIFSTITSTGGGGGGSGTNPPTIPVSPGAPGGSGGGAGGFGPGTKTGGSGNTPPVSPSQGNNGGNTTAPGAGYSSAGGGGAGTAGTANPNAGAPTAGTAGGNGVTTSISASPVAYAGGGGGGGWCAGGGAGGTGGGGAGGPSASNPTVSQNGTTNLGGGGGGGRSGAGPSPVCGGANGGSGIVIIRYKFQ